MSPTSSQQRTRPSSQQWTRRIRYSDQHIRVSDAERNAVAEQLGAHYGDGRLDQAEFDERVSRAMTAKTRGDLDGLFDDLPDPEPTGASGTGGTAVPYRARRRGGALRAILLLVLIIAVMSATWHAFAFVIPLFWIAALAAVVLFATRSSRHQSSRHHHNR
jgi:uncharacterized protein DUF1707